MDGLILIDKPQNFTSHDVVVEIRKILNIRKVGHFGTLDPLATGLMVLATGKATRLFPFFLKADKVYRGVIRLGFPTDTYDSAGKPTSAESKKYPKKESLLRFMKTFEGESQQVPPPYSAKKHKGKPLYALVREGKEFELKPNRVVIHFFRLIKYSPPLLEFEVRCSSGTYVRSLAHNLGQSLGCGAHLSELTRTDFGNFHLSESLTIEKIKRQAEEGKFEEFLIPLELLLPEYPKIILGEQGSVSALNGGMIFPENILKIIPGGSSLSKDAPEREKIFRMFSREGKLLALAKKVPEKNCFHPFLVIDSEHKLQ